MFGGGAKPTFGQPANGTGFGMQQAAAVSPFGQPAFGKPATAAFGQAPAFGQQNTTLFGAAQNPGAGLFGASTSTAFGAPAATAPQTTFGGFQQQPQQNTTLFGAAQTNANQPSMFGQTNTSAFGAAKPSGFGFGQPAQPTTSLFAQPAAAAATTGFGTFGQTAPATTNVFGATAGTAFGQAAAQPQGGANGSALAKYQPTIGTDTLMKNGQQNNVNTKQHCITAMKEYEDKSFEEIRCEDYMANRKGPQPGATAGGFFGQQQTQQPTAGGLFGQTPVQQTTGLFGQQADNKSVFGQQSAFGATNTSAFGAAPAATNSFLAKPFTTPATSTAGGFGFGAAANNTASPFGAKTFGQTAAPSLFGQQAAQTAAPAFGQPATGFGTFGAATQPTSVFGATTTANTTGFGLPASSASAGFGGFGTNVNTNTSAGGFFGAKPATGGFGAAATPFGATSTAPTAFGGFGTTTNTAGSLFNNTLNKPATTGFGGFGAAATTAPIGGGLNFNSGTPSLFGTTAKPGGMFGTAPAAGGGMFGGGGTNTLGGFGTTNTLNSFGQTTLGGATTLGATPQQQVIPIHQQIVAKITSPYGDNPIFKDLKPLRGDETDSLKPTNPIAQKAILDSTANQYKLLNKPTSAIKVKPVGNALTKKSLFEGLEEHDSTVEESFSLKPNAKRLILKSKRNGENTPNTSFSTPVRDNSLNQSINQRTPLASANNFRNESFSGEIPLSQPAAVAKDNDTSRRESWLHQNALEKVRQQNVHSESLMNNTLSELVPRKSADLRTSLATTEGSPFSDDGNLTRKESHLADGVNDSMISNRSFLEERSEDPSLLNAEAHPTGIVLRRLGYYTIPTLDDLKSYLSENGTCIVPNFTIGREGYGNVFFNRPLDVADLNLDEIVHFRNKEVIIYPDDENKPPVGSGLNREAQVTLDQVWPHDKTKHEAIKDPERLEDMEYEAKLRRVCDKQDIRFIEYRPETGSWVFRVKHFSKYGLNDSDEEDEAPTDPKKLKMTAKDQDKLKNEIAVEQGAKKNTSNLVPTEAQNGASNENNFLDITPIDFDVRGSHYDKTKKIGLTSPTAALAQGAGTDSHKLQLMKASFFVDEDMDCKSVISETYDGRDSPDQIVPNKLHSSRSQDLYSSSQSLWRDGYCLSGASSQLDFPVKSPQINLTTIDEGQTETDTTKIVEESFVKQSPLILKPKVAPVKIFDVNIPYEYSLVKSYNGKCLSDVAVFNARRFKITFGPQNTIVFPTTRKSMLQNLKDSNLEEICHIFEGRQKTDYTPTVLQNIKITSAVHNDTFEKSIIEHLEIQLGYSLQVEVEDSDCPFIRAKFGTKLVVDHLEEAKKLAHLGNLEEYAVSVWSLCLALWGDQEELEGQEVNNHYTIMCRRNLLSEWLEITLTEKDISSKHCSKNSYLDNLMDLLMCHKVTKACELAFQSDDANLALLLAQLSSGPTVRQLMEDQLAAWNKDEADKFISVERLKLFMLVAGISLMNSYHGPINNLEGIEWVKVLALQIWYLCSPTCSITDAVIAYEKSFTSEEFYALPPNPIYEEKFTTKDTRTPIFDLRYHILQLYSKRSHPMESLLNPATHTPDPMDYRLSWLILQTFEALGYHHCSELSESELHIGFASQLENNGLWHWAIFVLLHIKNKDRRELCIQNVLYRYVSVSKEISLTENEKFVINSLGIPEKWIDWAKAVKAGAIGNYHLQAKYLLKAKQWTLAHEVIFQHIAPDAIINDNLYFLHNLLIQFESNTSKRNVKVPNWGNQGQIFLDFIEINDKFKNLKTLHEGDMEARWENLKPQLADLCSRINLLPCPTPKHRLCQSEIAQNLARLVRGILLACPVLNPCLIIKIALEKLPLPQEFAQHELRALLDTLVADMCNSPNSMEK